VTGTKPGGKEVSVFCVTGTNPGGSFDSAILGSYYIGFPVAASTYPPDPSGFSAICCPV